ncbi:DUF397 domain-containing protein [Actinoplanes sp. NPDC048791]|uniref:DUF397 domain-containing protein n=1 Tax=Actinoplanes sp. NPDC048791 TaxID=3154623 RepID=UPI0033E074BD
MNADSPKWRKSSFCGSNACVEVAEIDGKVAVRDSKDTRSAVLTFTRDSWDAFVTGIKDGDFEQC